MRKITLSLLTVAIAGLPLLAAEYEASDDYRDEFSKQFRAKNDIIMRLGVDALGRQNDTSMIAGTDLQVGTDRKTGYEVSIGAESKVKDTFGWGARRYMSFYDYGDSTYYNRGYRADISNYGVETNMATFYKISQYFKPYAGIGFGINLNRYNDHGTSVQSEKFQLTLNVAGGVSGELFAGIGYYAEYKYRYADNSTYVVASSTPQVTAENKGVSGGVMMAGLSYQF